AYNQTLDNFKINQLGLPVDSNIALDDHELESLEIRHPTISVDDSIKVALTARQDYQNVKDRYDDSIRRVSLAANFLKPQLDLTAIVGIDSKRETSARFAVPDIDRYHWSAGLTLDPGLDRKIERNGYRTALINQKLAERALELDGDEMILHVRDRWRALDQAK